MVYKYVEECKLDCCRLCRTFYFLKTKYFKMQPMWVEKKNFFFQNLFDFFLFLNANFRIGHKIIMHKSRSGLRNSIHQYSKKYIF